MLRLRQVMLDSVRPDDPPGTTAWHTASLPLLRARLADSGDFAAFVVDHPERSGGPGGPGALAALAVGSVEYRIGRADNPGGRVGHVFSVATDPDARRRGYARACVTELLAWLRASGASHVDLNASAEAEPLYASLGFVRKPDPAMRLRF